MKIGFILSEEESSNDINNFTVANAIYKACRENNICIAIDKSFLDVKTIAEMLLLECANEEELFKARERK